MSRKSSVIPNDKVGLLLELGEVEFVRVNRFKKDKYHCSISKCQEQRSIVFFVLRIEIISDSSFFYQNQLFKFIQNYLFFYFHNVFQFSFSNLKIAVGS